MIPESWRWVNISDVGQIITGNTPSTKDKANYGNDIPFVKPPELNDKGIWSAPDGLSHQGMKRARQLPPGSVLVSCIGGLGKTGIARVQMTFNQQINAIVFDERVIPEFGFYYAQTLKEWLYSVSSATTLPIVNKGKFQQVSFPLAPIEDQKRIVAEIEKQFSRLDDAVANLKRVKANLKRYKAAVLKAAVEGKLTEEWRKANPNVGSASELLRRILAERRKKWEENEQTKMKSKGTKAKDDRWKQKYQEPTPAETTDLPELPHGWTWASIEQLAIAEPNAIKAGPFGSALKKSFYTPKGYKIYGQEQVINGDPFYGDYYIDETRYNTLKSCAVKPGDILISLVGTIGRVLILPKGIEPGIINPRLVKLSIDPRLVCAEFIKACIESPFVKQLFSLISHGGTMDVLNLTILKSIPFPLPSLKEQNAILQEIDRVSSIEKGLETTISVNLLRAERLRQTVLMKAFSGSLLN